MDNARTNETLFLLRSLAEQNSQLIALQERQARAAELANDIAWHQTRLMAITETSTHSVHAKECDIDAHMTGSAARDIRDRLG